MRMLKKWTRPILESLESRVVPASVVYTGSLLTITMQRAFLTVEEISLGTYQVKEGTSLFTLQNVGTYRTNGITINGTNAADTITVTFLNAGGLAGNLTINSGNGNDTVNIVGAATTATIRGSFLFDGGFGNDILNVGTNTKLSIRGTSSLNGNLGNDTLDIGTGAGGQVDLNVVNTNNIGNITLGGTGAGSSKVNISSHTSIQAGTSTPLNLLVNSKATLASLSVTGSVLDDFVEIKGAITGNTNLKYALDGNMGLGNDTLLIRANTVVGDPFRNTGIRWLSGDGADTVDIRNGVQIGGDLYLQMSATVNDVANTFNFGTKLGTGVSVANNLIISFVVNGKYGSAADESITFNGQVGGGIVLELGSGNNTFVFNGTLAGPISVSNYSSNIFGFGGPGSGEGNNSITFNLTGSSATVGFVPVDPLDPFSPLLGFGILMGSGNDDFTFNFTGLGPHTITGLLDSSSFDGGAGTNTIAVPVGTIFAGNPSVNFTII